MSVRQLRRLVNRYANRINLFSIGVVLIMLIVIFL